MPAQIFFENKEKAYLLLIPAACRPLVPTAARRSRARCRSSPLLPRSPPPAAPARPRRAHRHSCSCRSRAYRRSRRSPKLPPFPPPAHAVWRDKIRMGHGRWEARRDKIRPASLKIREM
ncbi:hypothetical protein SEVIR_5G121202v4 [Setaria viridis]